MGASWVGRQTRPALKALILASEYYSNQIRGTGFLDPEWRASVAVPKEQSAKSVAYVYTELLVL